MSRRGTLALRVYALTAVISVAVMAALLALPRFVGSPRYLEPQAALVQNLVDRLSVRVHEDPARFDDAMVRLASRIKGTLTLYDASGHVVRSTAQPPVSAATASEREVLASDKWALDWGRIVVRSDDGSMIGAYAPHNPGFPWGFVLPLGAGVLIVVGAVSIWFSRRLVHPLEQLAEATRRFGTVT
jgi:hypothetical protein